MTGPCSLSRLAVSATEMGGIVKIGILGFRIVACEGMTDEAFARIYSISFSNK
jgi:hypothetical protein